MERHIVDVNLVVRVGTEREGEQLLSARIRLPQDDVSLYPERTPDVDVARALLRNSVGVHL